MPAPMVGMPPVVPQVPFVPQPVANVPYLPDARALKDAIVKQVDYYFSVQNLVKDMFLRRMMDDNHFVSLQQLANFNRVRRLTPDVAFIAEALKDSTVVEVIDGKVRRREHPEQFPRVQAPAGAYSADAAVFVPSFTSTVPPAQPQAPPADSSSVATAISSSTSQPTQPTQPAQPSAEVDGDAEDNDDAEDEYDDEEDWVSTSKNSSSKAARKPSQAKSTTSTSSSNGGNPAASTKSNIQKPKVRCGLVVCSCLIRWLLMKRASNSALSSCVDSSRMQNNMHTQALLGYF